MSREHYQCIVTGFLSDRIPYDDLESRAMQHPGVGIADLEAACIVPLAPNTPSEAPISHTWDMLKSWTQMDTEGYSMECPENSVLLTRRERRAFGMFKLWFECVPGAEHTYTVSWRDHQFSNIALSDESGRLRVVFEAQEVYEGEVIPPPDARLLRAHAALCRVLHACGAVKVYEGWKEDEARSKRVVDHASLVYVNSLLMARAQVEANASA
ncbi:hypothetical protein CYLTODRAFT_258534 [Cylindrobasidium torrendii FP15055 ss-10]|uniref:HNH nuclease domain-containing protein n=1 Tax=Cylindrobasidium torrendii FP15055 ss-10 TaxID=1314674 RepID=A0A0D7BDF7_9AGAR|nr:hypothetical protein CYLTODRAFT_258534 [Cylindrobasidium torrendii FP15055 ss-10]